MLACFFTIFYPFLIPFVFTCIVNVLMCIHYNDLHYGIFNSYLQICGLLICLVHSYVVRSAAADMGKVVPVVRLTKSCPIATSKSLAVHLPSTLSSERVGWVRSTVA